MKKYISLTFLCLMVVALFAAPALAGDSSKGAANAQAYGLLTLIPPLVAIVLAFLTKNVVLSLPRRLLRLFHARPQRLRCLQRSR